MVFMSFTVQSIPAIFYNFKTKWLPIHYSWVIPIFPFLTSIYSFNLRHIHYQRLAYCELNLTHGNQRSQHSENGSKIARNSETRWKLLSNNDGRFKFYKKKKGVAPWAQDVN